MKPTRHNDIQHMFMIPIDLSVFHFSLLFRRASWHWSVLRLITMVVYKFMSITIDIRLAESYCYSSSIALLQTIVRVQQSIPPRAPVQERCDDETHRVLQPLRSFLSLSVTVLMKWWNWGYAPRVRSMRSQHFRHQNAA